MGKIVTLSLLILSLNILFSCGSIQPESPEIKLLELVDKNQPASTISVPIKLNLKPYFEETDESIPMSFEGKEQNCEGTSYQYKFDRGPIHFDGLGNRIIFDVNGKYSLKLNYCPQCTGIFNYKGSCVIPRIYSSCGVNEPMRDIEVGYATKLSISKSYKLQSETKLHKVKPITPCEITLFNYDATGTLVEEITAALKDLEEDIDEEISSIDLKPELQEVWSLMEEPIEVEGYGFLYLNPKSVSMSPIQFKGDTAYFDAILDATPSILTKNVDYLSTEIPDLDTHDPQEGFDITMDVYATYDSLSSIINHALNGTEIPIQKKKITLRNASVFGAANDGIHLKVDFDGDKRGTFYFTGTPVFDTTLQKISFPDLAFNVKTKSALLKSAKWLFNKKVTNTIRTASEIDLQPYLDTLKNELNTSINIELVEGTFMSGQIDRITMQSIHPKQDILHLRFKSLGKLEISL